LYDYLRFYILAFKAVTAHIKGFMSTIVPLLSLLSFGSIKPLRLAKIYGGFGKTFVVYLQQIFAKISSHSPG
jgi:hypothetical protein